MFRRVASVLTLAVGFAASGVIVASPAAAISDGPVILMGIDAEHHNQFAAFTGVVNSLLADASKGSNILVLGGGKAPVDEVTTFWNTIVGGGGLPVGTAVTFRNGAANMNVAFGPYELVVVSSDYTEVTGGLTDAENNALGGRDSDFADHVNAGGGLLVFTQVELLSPYAFLGEIGEFSTAGHISPNITATPAGMAVGIGDPLDVNDWHEEYIVYPSFLKPLAHYANTTKVAAMAARTSTCSCHW